MTQGARLLRTFIQVAALSLTLIAGVMLVRGSFTLTSKDIEGLSSTYYGFNRSMIKNLSQQQSDAKIGVALLMLAAILQMANLLWPMRWADFEVNKTGAILGIIVSFFILILALFVSNTLSGKTYNKVVKTLEQDK